MANFLRHMWRSAFLAWRFGRQDPKRAVLEETLRLLGVEGTPSAPQEVASTTLTWRGQPVIAGCSGTLWVESHHPWPQFPAGCCVSSAPLDTYARAKHLRGEGPDAFRVARIHR